jgi:ABC-type lipoprotein export system ATPase subunit/GNAT superfamily N-acetyltransferase
MSSAAKCLTPAGTERVPEPAAARAADSERVTAVCRSFGIHAGPSPRAETDLRPMVRPGRIVAVVGPSGSGKSTALARCRQAGVWVDVAEMRFAGRGPILDEVAPQASVAEAVSVLTRCGLGDAHLWLRSYAELSEGEKFRARLARAVAQAAVSAPGAGLVVDEFASGLHRRLARSIAYNLRKLATQRRMPVLLATPHTDVLADLQPDVLVTLSDTGEPSVRMRIPARRAPTLWRRLEVVRGGRADYAAFAAMHYRGGEELGFVDCVYTLRERGAGSVLGVVVYSHAPAELALRNQATGGRYKGQLALLNRDVRILRRLVVHPDLRGTGIAHRFVKRTLPLVVTRYVECLAAMGQFNPVFERAGMRRIGTCRLPASQQRLLDRLGELGADPLSADFAVQIARRPQVREVVVRLVREWYEATSGGGAERPLRQSPVQLARLARGLAGSRPVYYLWERRRGKTNRILRLTNLAAPTTPGSPARRTAHALAGLLPPFDRRRSAG